MLRGEELGELRAEDGEGGHAEQRGKVAGAGVVADEASCAGEGIQKDVEFVDRIVEEDDIPAEGA